MSKVILSDEDSGRTKRVNPGDTIEITLPENPTTGYRWSLDECDAATLDVLRNEFEPAQGGAIGAGGRRIIQLRARGAGSTVVRAAESRPWERTEPVRTFEIRLEIE